MRYRCSQCSETSVKHYPRCPKCKAFNTIVQDSALGGNERGYFAQPITEIPSEKIPRLTLGILDEVLGGGAALSSIILLSGEPGIGKSTVLLQACLAYISATEDEKSFVLYATGEEILGQVKDRAVRLDTLDSRLLVMHEQDIEAIELAIDEFQPGVFVLDSLQSTRIANSKTMQGSVPQLNEITNRVVTLTKQSKMVSIITGHVTSDGSIAGPKTVEHLVDTVLHFGGERDGASRYISAFKNRYGAVVTVELTMGEKGLSNMDR